MKAPTIRIESDLHTILQYFILLLLLMCQVLIINCKIILSAFAIQFLQNKIWFYSIQIKQKFGILRVMITLPTFFNFSGTYFFFYLRSVFQAGLVWVEAPPANPPLIPASPLPLVPGSWVSHKNPGSPPPRVLVGTILEILIGIR